MLDFTNLKLNLELEFGAKIGSIRAKYMSRVTRGKTPRFSAKYFFFLKNYQIFLNFVQFTYLPNSWGTF